MGGFERAHASMSLPRRKLDLLPFRNANPDKLENLTSAAGLSPDVSVTNYAANSSTLPFAAASVSPLRAKTMKEYDQQITELKKENFSLKLRIYFLEEKMQQKFGSSDDHLQVYKTNLELKVEMESLKRDLQDKIELLSQASGALEALEKQYRVTMQDLQEKSSKDKIRLEEQIQALSSRLENFGSSSMETSFDSGKLQKKEAIISKLTEEVKVLKERSSKSDKTIQGLFESIKSKEKEVQRLSRHLKEKNDSNCASDESFNQKSNQSFDCCDNKTRIKELRTVLDNFQEEAKKSAEAHAKICTEKDAMIDQLQKSLQNLQKTLEQKLIENSDKEQINNFEKLVLGLRNEIQDKDMQMEELKCEKKLFDDHNIERIGFLEDEVTKLQKDLDNEKKSRSYLKEKCEEKENELKSTRTLIAAKGQEIALLNQKNHDLTTAQHSLTALNDQSQKNQQIVEDLKIDLQNTKEELKMTKMKLTKSKEENNLFNTLLKEKEKDLNNAESKRLALAYKVSSMEERINELTHENQILVDEKQDFDAHKQAQLKFHDDNDIKEQTDGRKSDVLPSNDTRSKEYSEEEIKDLRNRLTQSFMCCDMLRCRLEEIANFLDRLLNYEKYDGQLTPQQIRSLHRFFVESRDLSQSLSMTLNGDNSSFSATRLSFESSSYLASPYIRCDDAGRESLVFPKLLEDPISVEELRKEEFSAPENLMSFNSLRLSTQDPKYKSPKRSLPFHPDSASDSDVWSEPDRDISLQRIGLDSSVLHPQINFEEKSTTTGDARSHAQDSSSSLNTSQGLQKSKADVTIIKRLYSKLKNLQHLNNSLKEEIHIYHNLEDERNSVSSNQLSPGFIAKHVAVVQALHDRLEKSIATNECLQKTLTKITHEGMNNVYNSNLIEEIAKYEAKFVKQDENYKQVCSANADLQEKLIKKCQELDLEKSTLSEVRHELNDSEKTINFLKTCNDELQTKNQNLTVELGQLEQINELLSKIKEEVLIKETKISELKISTNEKTKELKQVQDWNLRLQSENTDKQNQFKKLEMDAQVLIDEGCKKDETIKELKDNYLDLQSVLKTKNEKVEHLGNTNGELLNKLNELSKRNQEQDVRLEDLEVKLATLSKVNEPLESREVSTETSASFTHVAFPEKEINPDESQNTETAGKKELSSRVTNFLRNKGSPYDSFSKEKSSSSRLQTLSENRKNNYHSRRYDEINFTDSHHSSTHYSSPDLGIESDPSNHDGKDSVYSTVDEELSHRSFRYHNHSKLVDITNLDKVNVNELKKQEGNLFVVCPLIQHELLKKEIAESLIILSGMHSRVKDITKAYAKNSSNSSKCFEQSAMKVLDKNCKNIAICLQRSSEVLSSFSIFDMSTQQENFPESNLELCNQNQILQEELRMLRQKSDKYKRDMEDAVNKLSVVENKKIGMEKAITKQLRKTNYVLRQAKTNLQKPDA